MTKRLITVCCLAAIALPACSGCATGGRAKPTAERAKPTPEELKLPKFVLRVNCAALDPYTDQAGNVWLADQLTEAEKTWGAVGGMTVDRGELSIAGTDAPKVYQTERYSMDAYKFAVPNGTYTVRLHFAETYDGITGDGQRIFSAAINDQPILKDFDPYKEAGGFQKPVVKTIRGVAVTNGELLIAFTANIQNPEINGIEILAE
ncbi:MAG: malectin [Sedimentisphaerales bacterium]|nr:malectin [Sedimentisphaerales bacterium]